MNTAGLTPELMPSSATAEHAATQADATAPPLADATVRPRAEGITKKKRQLCRFYGTKKGQSMHAVRKARNLCAIGSL